MASLLRPCRALLEPIRARRAILAGLAASALGLSALAAAPGVACGQDLEPRAYVNTPVGVNFVIMGYAYTQGRVGTDPSLPITDLRIQTHGPVVAYVRTLDVWGRSGKLDVILPYATLSGRAQVAGQARERDVSGFADPRVRFSVNLYGAPALSVEDFSRYKPDFIVGASLQVSAPGGQYDSDKAVNIGSNRWSVKPELGLSKVLGPLTLEVTPSVTIFTDNDDFFGGKHVSQEPMYSVQGHLIYRFDSGPWVALNSTYYAGGRTTVDDVKQDNRQENVRLGLTVSLPIDRALSLKLYGSTAIYTRTDSAFDAAGIALQFRWGGGQ